MSNFTDKDIVVISKSNGVEHITAFRTLDVYKQYIDYQEEKIRQQGDSMLHSMLGKLRKEDLN